jgi:hypothetical protein
MTPNKAESGASTMQAIKAKETRPGHDSTHPVAAVLASPLALFIGSVN